MSEPLGISNVTKSAFAGLIGALNEATSADAAPEQGETPGVAAVAAGSPALSIAEIARRFMRTRYGAVPTDEEAKDRYMTRLGLVLDALHFAENEAQENVPAQPRDQ